MKETSSLLYVGTIGACRRIIRSARCHRAAASGGFWDCAADASRSVRSTAGLQYPLGSWFLSGLALTNAEHVNSGGRNPASDGKSENQPRYPICARVLESSIHVK